MINTYVEGKVLRKEFPFITNWVPMKRCEILYHINISLTKNTCAPFFYSSGRKQYLFETRVQDKGTRIKFEQMSRYVHEISGTPIKEETLKRRMRLVLENSLYGADGLTEQELLSKKG